MESIFLGFFELNHPNSKLIELQFTNEDSSLVKNFTYSEEAWQYLHLVKENNTNLLLLPNHMDWVEHIEIFILFLTKIPVSLHYSQVMIETEQIPSVYIISKTCKIDKLSLWIEMFNYSADSILAMKLYCSISKFEFYFPEFCFPLISTITEDYGQNFQNTFDTNFIPIVL